MEKNRICAQYIKNIAYYPIRMILEVQFHNDECIYQYYDVPEHEWYAMKNTYSMDLYFNMQIATHYRYKCISKGRIRK